MIPEELIEIILLWVEDFNEAEVRIKLEHMSVMFPVLCEINSLPFKLECVNCNKLSTHRYICCKNMCENCEIYCQTCCTKGCSDCIDSVDTNECLHCQFLD
jgi:hypothetical protein